jgi:hypothetical protein
MRGFGVDDMNDETVNKNEEQAEVFPENFGAQMIPCPNCKETVPTSLYCLKCGYPLYMFRQQEEGVDVVLPPDEGSLSHMQEISKNLMNAISMKLWSVEQLREGTLEAEHFERLFEDYQARSVQCIGKRKVLLARYSRELTAMARDLEPVETALKEAKVKLRELEMRRSIGDLLEGEYEAKGPAYKWEIRNYEDDMTKRKGEMTFLEDITKVIPAMEIEKSKDKVEEANICLEDMLREGRIGPETATRVKVSLDETRTFLDNFR